MSKKKKDKKKNVKVKNEEIALAKTETSPELVKDEEIVDTKAIEAKDDAAGKRAKARLAEKAKRDFDRRKTEYETLQKIYDWADGEANRLMAFFEREKACYEDDMKALSGDSKRVEMRRYKKIEAYSSELSKILGGVDVCEKLKNKIKRRQYRIFGGDDN